jgi:hypothetical protein
MKLQLGDFYLMSLLPFCCGVLGGQIPEVNGALGGISDRGTISQREIYESVNSKRTPGKLRGVVENSGVCGPSLFLVQFRM